ncbi:MAG: crotonase/enoyl-CoA hydratase family protein [Notoacmeibacter sp.]|nr:crotonase/enoyl-CoA hydratase family protein [Notoacmeibacter sp.]MCC0031837.1 crotonase/enoyl-CoA hydratase family protein [Brucellaceae bacterium]
MAGTDFFRIERHGPVAHVAMNRPASANAMDPDFWDGLPAVMASLDGDTSVRACVISGEGRHFSGGMDLAAFNGIAAIFSEEPGRAAYKLRELVLRLQASLSSLEKVRFPVIAAIHGACIGGAIDMITACDIRIASVDAFFSIEEINIGMAADVGTLQRLPKLIAPAIAAELAYTGRRFDAAEAKAFGLISAVHESRETMIAAALVMAEQIAARSPLAMAGIKRNLAYARDHPVADGLDYIATWNGGMLRGEDLMEALGARAQKRAALFKDMA